MLSCWHCNQSLTVKWRHLSPFFFVVSPSTEAKETQLPFENESTYPLLFQKLYLKKKKLLFVLFFWWHIFMTLSPNTYFLTWFSQVNEFPQPPFFSHSYCEVHSNKHLSANNGPFKQCSDCGWSAVKKNQDRAPHGGYTIQQTSDSF